MPNSVNLQAVLAHFSPSELPPAVEQGRRVLSNLDDILSLLHEDPASVVIVYPLLSVELFKDALAMQAWQAFYQPLMGLRLRGVRGITFVPQDQWAGAAAKPGKTPSPLVLKLASLLYPEALVLQDQLELYASGLQREPVFLPVDTKLQTEELLDLLTQAEQTVQPATQVQRLVDSIYKNKADMLEAQLQLLQSEFASTNEELEQLRVESMLTADLILAAGSRIMKG